MALFLRNYHFYPHYERTVTYGGQQQGGQYPHLTQDEVRLTTGRAAVWPLSRVSHPVLHQLPLHVEGLPTLITGKYLVSCVCLFVLFQIAEIAEP